MKSNTKIDSQLRYDYHTHSLSFHNTLFTVTIKFFVYIKLLFYNFTRDNPI